MAIARASRSSTALEYVELSRFEVVPAATSLLPENVARRLSALIGFDEDETDRRRHRPDRRDGLRRPAPGARPPDPLRRRLRHRPGAHARPLLPPTCRSRWSGRSPRRKNAELEDITEGDAADAPAIKLTNQIIANAIAEGASDIHFEPQPQGMVVRARIDGVMRKDRRGPDRLMPAVTSRLKIMGELDIADRRTAQDGRVSIRYDGDPIDLRIAVLPTTFGEKVVLRILHRASGGSGSRTWACTRKPQLCSRGP